MMADKKLTEIEKKKKELEAEISRIQKDLDKSIDDVKEDVVTSLDPKTLIRKHPLKALGISVFLGFILGSENNGTKEGKPTDSLGSTISYELKRAFMKKGIGFLVDYMDDKVDELKGKISH